MKKILHKLILCSIMLMTCALVSYAFGEESTPEEPGYAGEFFDIKVPLQNYYFVKSVLMVFGRRGRPLPEDSQELEQAVWEELVLSYEAFRRGIEVSTEELQGEVANVLSNNKADFDWKNDKEAYAKWVQEKTGEPVELFENQLRHLKQIEKLQEQIMQSIEPKVTNQEAYERFQEEYSSLNVELIRFDQKEDAQEFFQKAKANKKFWDKEKEKKPEEFKSPAGVSIAFLIDLWRFPRDACFKMLNMKEGQIHPPTPIYKGYAVFKVIGGAKADKSKFGQMKEHFMEKIKKAKRYEGMNKWVEDLKKQAKIKVYPLVKPTSSENQTNG